MAIDSSIYNNIKQFEVPSLAESQAKAMNLSQLAMQNRRMMGQSFKEDEEMKIAAKSRMTKMAIPKFETLMGMPEQQRAEAYDPFMKELEAQGMPTENLFKDQNGIFVYDPKQMSAQFSGIQSQPEWEAHINSKLDMQKKRAEISSLNRKASGEYDPYKQLMFQKLQEDMSDKRLSKTPEGRLKGLSGDSKQRYDNAKLGMVSVQGMADSLNAGDNTFSLIGDNDFTQQRTLFEEALGRMQSGGAINKEEERRFKGMAPTLTDSSEMRMKKLTQLQSEMSSRLGTLGFSPEDAGLSMRNLTVKKPSMAAPNLGISEANASDIPKHGTVEEGFVFMGGDPSNQKNWKRAK